MGYQTEAEDTDMHSNEAPRSKLRGIKAELRRSLRRLRSIEFRNGSSRLSSLQSAGGGQGIQAKANNKLTGNE